SADPRSHGTLRSRRRADSDPPDRGCAGPWPGCPAGCATHTAAVARSRSWDACELPARSPAGPGGRPTPANRIRRNVREPGAFVTDPANGRPVTHFGWVV